MPELQRRGAESLKGLAPELDDVEGVLQVGVGGDVHALVKVVDDGLVDELVLVGDVLAHLVSRL